MRTIKLYITALVVLLAAWSCEKDGDLIVVSGLNSSKLSIDNTDIVLSFETQSDSVLALSWTESSLSLSDGTMKAPASIPGVTIEASATSDFESTVSIDPTSNPHFLKGLSLNTLTKNLGLEPWASSPVYFRTRTALGKNTEPKYSEVLKVNVTPFLIDMTKGFILNTEKEETEYFLYSPESNGEYSGFMNATGWYEWYLVEGDGTTWGNVGEDGNEFKLSNVEDAHWNMWFPGVGGAYYTTLNTEDKEWSATHIPKLLVNGDVEGEMSFVKSEVYWLFSFTTTSDNAKFTVGGDTKLYNKSTSTVDADAIDGHIVFQPNEADHSLAFSLSEDATEFTIPTAGEYTLKLFVSDPSNLNYTITEGSTVIEEPISEYLYLLGIDDIISGGWNFNNYLRLLSDMDSTFAGVVNVSSEWGYKMGLEDGNWEDVYTYAADGQLEFMGENNIPAPDAGLYLIEADLKSLTYSHTAVTSLSYSGFNGNWDLVQMTESSNPGVYTSPLAITEVSEWGGKLYLNDNWDFFFGGKDGLLNYSGDGIQDDKDIALGSYDLIANLPDATYVLLGDEVYISGLNDVFDFTSVVLSKSETGVYRGSATINTPSPYGITIQIDKSWDRFFGGTFEKLTFGGENITDDQSLAAGTYDVTVDFINNICSFELAD